MKTFTIIMFFFLLVFISSIIFIAKMLISLSKQGDERRKFIVLNAAANTFYAVIGMLLIDAVVSSFTSVKNLSSPAILIATSFLYSIYLSKFKKKFGG